MKPKSHRVFASPLLVIIATAASTAFLFAASGTWTSNASGDWLDSTKWTGGNVPNASGDIATLGGDWTGQTITVTAATVGQILASDSASVTGGLTISGGTLTLANGVNSPIISTGANSNFNESAALRFKISSVLAGTNGFERQGSGYLDLSGTTNLFTGTIRLTAPASGGGSFTVINSDANLGNSANVITVATTTQPIGFYNDASAGAFTLNSARTITTTGTGDFWVKNKTGSNMTIAGVISGTARLRKNDSGTLTLGGANDYTGGTFLEGGTLVLSGGNNRLTSGSTLTLGSGTTLDVGTTSQTLGRVTSTGSANVISNFTVNGAGGKLLVNGDFLFQVTGANGVLVNMTGLSEFEYNRSTRNFVMSADSAAAASSQELRLAGNGTAKNTITAAAVSIGGASTSNGADNLSTLRLGLDNTINAGSIQLGAFNGRGTVNFLTISGTKTLKLRGADGVSAMTSLNLGLTSSGTRSGAGVLDLTGGSLDALVTNVVIGNNTTAITDNSALTMPAGSLSATSLKIGVMSLGTTNPIMNNSLNQGGGTVTAGTLTLGENTSTSGVPTFNSSYNLAGGTLRAGAIQAGSGSFNSTSLRRIAWTGGTLATLNASTDLVINGVAGTGGSIILATSTATAKDFNVDAARTLTLGANTALTGSADLAKTGSGTLLINGAASAYTGTLTVSAGTLAGASSFGGRISVDSGGRLAPGASPDTIGTLAAKGVTWTGGSIWDFNLSAGTPGSSDLLTIDGNFTKGGSGTYQFNFRNSAPTVWGATYTLASWTGTTDFVPGNFSYTNLGGEFDLKPGTGFSFSGNSLVFTAVPEPTSALAGLLIGAGLLRRRRQ